MIRAIFRMPSMILTAAALGLSACGGGGESAPPVVIETPPEPPMAPQKIITESSAEASLFLKRASFGASQAEIDALRGTAPADWVAAQIALPPTLYLAQTSALYDTYPAGPFNNKIRAHRSIAWKHMVDAPDQLRQRMVFALSQIVVASDAPMPSNAKGMAFYMDAIAQNALGNYRDLLEDVTYTPAMARYLTYLNNRKGDPVTGRQPDENYAREILQLFSIGLNELNPDGTEKTGADGTPILTYTNADIINLARVFTGLGFGPGVIPSDPDDPAQWTKLPIIEAEHSPLEKTFLGRTIPAGTSAEASISQALDIIFEHPNVGPFLARQLIQRLTASHPEPAYVARVAAAFEAGSFTAQGGTQFGTRQRGDLAATVAAILLDESQFGTATHGTTDYGKVREPVLNFVHWARAFNVTPNSPENEWSLLSESGDPARELGQQPFSAPSVFNYYRPGYIAPGTESGAAGLTVPEFQIVYSGSRRGYVRFMSDYVTDYTFSPEPALASYTPDYSDEMALAHDPAALADHLNAYLMDGRMSAATRQAIIDVVDEITLRAGASENEADRKTRAGLAVAIAVTAPAYIIAEKVSP